VRTNNVRSRYNKRQKQLKDQAQPDLFRWTTRKLSEFAKLHDLHQNPKRRTIGVIQETGVSAGVWGIERLKILAVDTVTGLRVEYRYYGGTTGLTIASISAGLYVFTFDGPAENLAGASIGMQTSTAFPSMGVSTSVESGDVMVFGGMQSSVGFNLAAGTTWVTQATHDGVSTILAGSDEFLNGRVTGPAKQSLLKQLATLPDGEKTKVWVKQKDESVLLRTYTGSRKTDGSMRVSYRDNHYDENGLAIDKNPLSPSAGGPTNYFDIDAPTLKALTPKSRSESIQGRRSARHGPERAERHRQTSAPSQAEQNLMEDWLTRPQPLENESFGLPSQAEQDLMEDMLTSPQPLEGEGFDRASSPPEQSLISEPPAKPSREQKDKGQEGLGIKPPQSAKPKKDYPLPNEPIKPLLNR